AELLAKLGPRAGAAATPWFVKPADAASASASAQPPLENCMPLDDLARVTTETLARHNPSYIRLPLGWPGEYCRFSHPRDYIGFDGGGGIGSGPGRRSAQPWRCAAAIDSPSPCSAAATT